MIPHLSEASGIIEASVDVKTLLFLLGFDLEKVSVLIHAVDGVLSERLSVKVAELKETVSKSIGIEVRSMVSLYIKNNHKVDIVGIINDWSGEIDFALHVELHPEMLSLADAVDSVESVGQVIQNLRKLDRD